MSNPNDITIVDARLSLEPVPFRFPLKFGGRVVDRTDLLNVTVTVETSSGKQATGFGSMPVGHIWAWPTTELEPNETEVVMKAFADRIVGQAAADRMSGHPIEIEAALRSDYPFHASVVVEKAGLPETMVPLAQLVAASPLDAAIHDAYGRVHGINSYNALGPDFMNADLSTYLDDRFQGEYLDSYTSREPAEWMPLYHLVGALDPLTDSDIAERIDDGLPETLPEWIEADGLTHLKIKLSGEDLQWDIDRVLQIDAVTAEAQESRGCEFWNYSLDFNEKCESVDYVLEFLKVVREKSPAAYDRVQYVEQPTHRDLKAHPQNVMHEAAKLKPVVIDESLLDVESLHLAREQGYTGVALKACKGQSESLVLAAAAQKDDLFLCVQDLTCPGYSFLHSASLAARIPTIAAIEGNGRQYCPAPNAVYAERYPGMFDVSCGTVDTSELSGIGLGFNAVQS